MASQPSFDEAAWRSATEWLGPAPTLGRVWEILNDPEVARTFRARVTSCLGTSDTLGAAYVQSTASSGASSDAVLAAYRQATGRNARPPTVVKLARLPLLRRKGWNNAFANLVSGRFTELVFAATYEVPLREVGVTLEDATAERNFEDYRLVAADPAEPFELSVNVKNAGRQMRKAREFFGLEPHDTLPMATYKAFGAAGAVDLAPLVYVYLVDWTLLERLREAYWLHMLSSAEQEVFRLMTTFKGFPRDLEDAFVAATVEARLEGLVAAVGYAGAIELPFRAISAVRCHAIFYEQHDRSPYVFVKRMDTDPNVHISVKAETVGFGDLVRGSLATAAGRADLLSGLARTRAMQIPDPPM